MLAGYVPNEDIRLKASLVFCGCREYCESYVGSLPGGVGNVPGSLESKGIIK